MSETIELTTVKNYVQTFYKFPNHCLIFSVKGNGDAIIGIAYEPGRNNICKWIFIDRNGTSGITEYENICYDYEILVEVPTPNIIKEDKFQTFYLTYYDNTIKLGKFGETEPIFSHEMRLNNLNYVTFLGRNKNNTLHWKFKSTPKIERPTLKPITENKHYWVPYNGILPYGALIGGYEPEFTYVIRAMHEGSLIPGKYVPSINSAIISWDETVIIKTNFEVLCGIDCIWESSEFDFIPVGAIPAGYTEDVRENIYIGRVKWNEHNVLGKVISSKAVCYYFINDSEQTHNFYEILVDPHPSHRYRTS